MPIISFINKFEFEAKQDSKPVTSRLQNIRFVIEILKSV